MNPLAAVSAMAAVLVLLADPHGARLVRVVPPVERGATPSASRVSLVLSWRPVRRLSPDLMRSAVVELADAWAAELRSGRPPARAMAGALADGSAAFVVVGEQIRLGADPVAALLALAELPGAEGLRGLAACWRIGAGAGAALAVTAARVAQGLRDDLAVRQELEAQVAAPRATARLLACLPLIGPVLGALVGASTVDVLFGTSWGRLCLVAGLVLDAIGTVWVRAVVRSAAPS